MKKKYKNKLATERMTKSIAKELGLDENRVSVVNWHEGCEFRVLDEGENKVLWKVFYCTPYNLQPFETHRDNIVSFFIEDILHKGGLV